MKQVTELPEWFKILPKDAKLSTKDVALLFGFAQTGTVFWGVAHGSFPAPDCSSNTGFATPGHMTKRVFWSKKLILQEIQRRREKADGTS